MVGNVNTRFYFGTSAGQLWNRYQIGTDKPCIYTKSGRLALDRFSYPAPNGFTKATFTLDQICSDPFGIGSTLVRIHSVYTGLVRNPNGTVPHKITLHKWTHLVPDSGSDLPRAKTRLIRTSFVPVPNGSGNV